MEVQQWENESVADFILIPIKNQTSLCPIILPTVSTRFLVEKMFGSQILSDFQ